MRSHILSLLLVLIGACGHDEPAEVPKPSGPSEKLATIGRNCARIASCADAHDPTHLRNATSCVDWWLVSMHEEADLIDCMTRAKDCKAVELCTHPPNDLGAGAFCVAHPGALGVCDGSRLYNCSDDPAESSAVDCASLGGTCTEQRIAGGLVVRGCTSPKMCPPNAPVQRCEAESVIRCEDGLADKHPCPRGTHCSVAATGGEPVATCEGERSADRIARCSKPGYAACEGDRATFCTLVGKDAWLRAQDCAGYGLTCGMRNGRANCMARGATCTSAEPRCDGESLVFCAAGSEMRASCKELGFAKCDAAARGQAAGCR